MAVNLIEIKRKICLIGNGGVGKTSLIRKFVLDQFSDDYIATFGTKITKARIKFPKDEENIIDLYLMIWDVFGQKSFKKSQMKSYVDAKGAIIVCDITRSETVNDVISWYSDILSVTKEIPIVILGNKYDLKDEAEFEEEDLKVIAEQLNKPYMFTSAKTGENVEEAFREIGKQLID